MKYVDFIHPLGENLLGKTQSSLVQYRRFMCQVLSILMCLIFTIHLSKDNCKPSICILDELKMLHTHARTCVSLSSNFVLSNIIVCIALHCCNNAPMLSSTML